MFTYTLTYKSVAHIPTYLGQLQALSPSISSVNVSLSSITIDSTQELYSGALASLDAVTPASESIQKVVERSIESAIAFGQGLIVSFSAENVLLGITQEGKTGEVMAKLAGVMPAVQAGSLYLAVDLIKAIDPAQYDTKYVTAARLLAFVNKIEAYLGLPLSESL